MLDATLVALIVIVVDGSIHVASSAWLTPRPPCSLAGHSPDPLIAAALQRQLRGLAANLVQGIGADAPI